MSLETQFLSLEKISAAETLEIQILFHVYSLLSVSSLSMVQRYQQNGLVGDIRTEPLCPQRRSVRTVGAYHSVIPDGHEVFL